MVGFFSPEDEEKIIQAIKAAELNTSGEIRVHLHKKIYRGLMRDAKRAFKSMGMHKTEARNGVLIFIVPTAKKFAILGDEGIDPEGRSVLMGGLNPVLAVRWGASVQVCLQGRQSGFDLSLKAWLKS